MGSERELTSNSDMTAVESSLDLQRLLLQVSSKAREAIQYVKLDGLSVSEAAARSGRVQTSVFGRVKRDHRWLRPDRAGTKKTCSLRCKINQRQLSWRGRIGLLIEEDCLDVSVAGDNVVAVRWHIEPGVSRTESMTANGSARNCGANGSKSARTTQPSEEVAV